MTFGEAVAPPAASSLALPRGLPPAGGYFSCFGRCRTERCGTCNCLCCTEPVICWCVNVRRWSIRCGGNSPIWPDCSIRCLADSGAPCSRTRCLSHRISRRGPRMCGTNHRADRRSAIARQSDRQSHTRLSSRERSQPTPSNTPRHWCHYGNSDCRHGR